MLRDNIQEKPMFKIKLPPDRAEPDMPAVASAIGISVDDVEDDIQTGTISRWFEVGEGDEDNKPHQIFASAELGVRVDVDEHGDVQSVSSYKNVVGQTASTDRGDAGDKEAETLEPNRQDNPDAVEQAHLDDLLDEALDESFPASDPIAIRFDAPQRAERPPFRPDKT
jgi:hypothetical protein